MDKQTLSNYGWIVICILVLCVMIALATPFGSFIAGAVKSTAQGLFDVNQKAFNSVGFGQIPDQSIEDSYNGNGANGGAQVSVPGATFSKYLASPGCHSSAYEHTDSCYVIEANTLTWDELKLAENGTKYCYHASTITDTIIGKNAFSGCASLTSIDLPTSITSIGKAFRDCTSLTSIDFSGYTSLTSIGEEAFEGCTSLKSIDLSGCANLTSIGGRTFHYCTSLTSIDFSGCTSLTSIGTDDFKDCTSLTSIDLPENLTNIYSYAFQGCTSLTSIDLPDSLTSIGYAAFSNCKKLTSIDLPENLTNIDSYAFKYCTSLASITFDGTVAQWKAISFGANWNSDSSINQIICNDSTIAL